MSDPLGSAVWTRRRRRTSTDNLKTIEYVPGAKDGNRAYLWIGDRNGEHFATIDALTFARWFDSLQEAGDE